MRPLLITFEGLDGSGKSTQIKRVSEWLERSGVDSVMTHEPGGTAIGERIREIFLDHRVEPMDELVELLLVFASRRQHLTEVIEPALASGRHVLCDRFTDSSYAYQGAARGLSLELVDRVDEIATGRRRPDRTILFDLPAETARERGGVRRRDSGGLEADRLDREALSFYEKVRQGFLDRCSQEPERFSMVRSDNPIEETFEAVCRALSDLVV